MNSASHNLPGPVMEAITDAEEVAISAISIWEVMTAIQKGRIIVDTPPEQALRAWLRANPLIVIPVDTEIAFLSRTLEFGHSDPGDRFIAATAVALNAELATVDENLLRLAWLQSIRF